MNPFNYLNRYCNVKMALIIEGIFISKTVTSIQIKVHECYIKPLKPRESLLTIKDEEYDIVNERERQSDSDSEEEDNTEEAGGLRGEALSPE